nr:hypothetical protein [Tanacetum cinerariifolium]
DSYKSGESVHLKPSVTDLYAVKDDDAIIVDKKYENHANSVAGINANKTNDCVDSVLSEKIFVSDEDVEFTLKKVEYNDADGNEAKTSDYVDYVLCDKIFVYDEDVKFSPKNVFVSDQKMFLCDEDVEFSPDNVSVSDEKILVSDENLVDNTVDFDDAHVEEEQIMLVGSFRIGDIVQTGRGKGQAKLNRQPKGSSMYQLLLPKPQYKRAYMVDKFYIFYLEQSLNASSNNALFFIGLPSTKELLDALACHIMVEHVTPRPWTNTLEGFSLGSLLDLHDNSYTRQAIVDNQLNGMARELIKDYKKTKKDLEAVVAREVEPKAKYDGDVVVLDENSVVITFLEEVKTLEDQIKVHEADSKRAEVVAKVVPYVAMKLYYSDKVGQVIGNLVNAAIFHGRCSALEEIAATKEPVDLSKVKCYHLTYEEEYNKTGNTYIRSNTISSKKPPRSPKAGSPSL